MFHACPYSLIRELDRLVTNPNLVFNCFNVGNSLYSKVALVESVEKRQQRFHLFMGWVNYKYGTQDFFLAYR